MVRCGVGKCERIAPTNNSQSTCVFCMLDASFTYVYCICYGYTRISLQKRTKKKMKLFPIFVPSLTLLAVLFFLVNTILTHQLFT